MVIAEGNSCIADEHRRSTNCCIGTEIADVLPRVTTLCLVSPYGLRHPLATANSIPHRSSSWCQKLIENEAEAAASGLFQPPEDNRARVRDHSTHWCKDLPQIFQVNPPTVVEGHPSKRILLAVEKEECDLLVAGARGLGAVRRLLLGSTSEFLLRHAPCHMLIVPQHEKP